MEEFKENFKIEGMGSDGKDGFKREKESDWWNEAMYSEAAKTHLKNRHG